MHTARIRSRRRVGRETSFFSQQLQRLQRFTEKVGLGETVKAGNGRQDATPYDDCIFCMKDDIAFNRIMCENATFFARYDNFPSAPGHVEIIPKRHVESFFDLSNDEVLEAYALILTAQKKLIDEFNPPDGYTIGVNEGRAAGRSVDHLHIHLIPRYFGDVDDPRGGIRRATPNCDPDSWK